MMSRYELGTYPLEWPASFEQLSNFSCIYATQLPMDVALHDYRNAKSRMKTFGSLSNQDNGIFDGVLLVDATTVEMRGCI